MCHTEQNDLPFYRYNPWHDEDDLISLSEIEPLPADCFFATDGIRQRTPDRYFDYLFDLMLEGENALRLILGVLVDFKQRRKLMQFLLFFCDQLEIKYVKSNGKLLECQFRIDFSDRVSVSYSTQLCGCIIALAGKQDSFHKISSLAIDDLRCLLVEIWAQMRELPVWETIEENDRTVTCRRKESR